MKGVFAGKTVLIILSLYMLLGRLVEARSYRRDDTGMFEPEEELSKRQFNDYGHMRSLCSSPRAGRTDNMITARLSAICHHSLIYSKGDSGIKSRDSRFGKRGGVTEDKFDDYGYMRFGRGQS